MYSPHSSRARVTSRTTMVSALAVIAISTALFVAMRYTRPHDMVGALLFLGVFLVLGGLIITVRQASRREPLLHQGPNCAQQNPTSNLICSLPDGHHGPHVDRRTHEHFEQTLSGLVSGVTFYRDADGRREMIHDTF